MAKSLNRNLLLLIKKITSNMTGAITKLYLSENIIIIWKTIQSTRNYGAKITEIKKIVLKK